VLFPSRQIPSSFGMVSPLRVNVGDARSLVLARFQRNCRASGSAETGGAAVWAHIGGFIVGVLVALWLRQGRFGAQRQIYA
jgi:membrane associated rhomboid family serine protease